MRLISLHLENFKAHKNLKINFGEVTRILGRNGTGKTTIQDAFTWLLSGKDSEGRTNVAFRPLDQDGEYVHKVDVSVTAEIMIDDRCYTLERIYKEEYSAKKGEKLFKGNTTEYFIDAVPFAEKRYKQWVDDNIPPERFRLTSDPKWFPAMPWQTQREYLLRLAGEISDQDILSSNPDLEALKDKIGSYTIDDLKAMSMQKLKRANDKIKEDVVRIDQTSKLSGNNTQDDLEAQLRVSQSVIQRRQSAVQEAEQELANAKAGNRGATLKNEIAALDIKLDDFRSRRRNKIAEIQTDYRGKAADLKAELRNIDEAIKSKSALLPSLENAITKQEDKRNTLYDTYDSVDSETFDAAECPFCHQPLPQNKVEELSAKANEDKSKRLESIVREGKGCAEEIERLGKQIDLLKGSLKNEQERRPDVQAKLDRIMDECAAVVARLPQLEDIKEFRDLRSKRDMKAGELRLIEDGNAQSFQLLTDAVTAARSKLGEAMEELEQIKMQMSTLKENERLEEELSELRRVVDDETNMLQLINLFIQTKCNALTDAVSSLFPGLEWRLFKKNITDDGIHETCELLMHGVPYINLSTGEKIKAGLIIINTLQEKLNMVNPVFIDNAESFTGNVAVKGQLILLQAVSDVEKLKIREEE